MSLVCGIDLSTKRIDVAAITYDDPVQLWLAHYDLAQADKGAERARNAGDAARDCLASIERQADRDVTSVAIEVPSGRFVHPSLGHAYGAICASMPSWVAITGYAPSQWRKLIGAKNANSKESGHERIVAMLWSGPSELPFRDFDEHELDSVGIALAYRAMQWENAA